MERDIARGRCDQDRGGRRQGGERFQAKLACDAEADRGHEREAGILNNHENQRMPRDPKDRREQENNWFHMISKKRNLKKRDFEAPVKKLPNALDVKGEIEGAVFEVSPACVRG